MALSYNTYTGDAATTNFSVSFDYIATSHVKVYLDGVLQTVTTHYTWFNATTIQFLAAPAAGVTIRIDRETPNTARLVDFQDAGNLTEYDLDTNSNQVFYLVQETKDGFDDKAMQLDTDSKWDAESYVIKNVTDPVDDQDAATKKFADDLWAANLATVAAGVAATAADVVTTNADVVLTNADAVSTAADAVSTASDAADTAADLVQTNLDTIATAADAVSTAADAASTAADVISTNADVVSTNADAVSTAADAAAAEVSKGYASDWAIQTVTLVNDGVDNDYSSKAWAIDTSNAYGCAKEWAIEVEDTVVGTTSDYSALHHAAKAAASASAAATSETNAATSYDDFDDRYLGSKASDPALDNDGDALLTGALYWNTTSSYLAVYDGAAWQAASVSPATHYTKTEIDTGLAGGFTVDADTMNGVSFSATSSASTIVQRNSSSNVFANYYHSTAADTTGSTSHVFVEVGSDGYIRPQTLSNFRGKLLTASSVTRTMLKTTTATGSTTLSAGGTNSLSQANFEYNIWMAWNTSTSGTKNNCWMVASTANTTSYPDPGDFAFTNSDTSSLTCRYKYRYIQSSPPYDLGDGDVPLFINLMLDKTTGEVHSMALAPDPSWAGNGPTNIKPEFYDGEGNAYVTERSPGNAILLAKRKLALQGDDVARAEYLAEARTLKETIVPLTMEMKVRDRDVIPHPWVKFVDYNKYQVVTLDPVGPIVREFYEMIDADEDSIDEISELLSDKFNQYFVVDEVMSNAKRKAPLLAPAARFRWKRT